MNGVFEASPRIILNIKGKINLIFLLFNKVRTTRRKKRREKTNNTGSVLLFSLYNLFLNYNHRRNKNKLKHE